MPGKKLDPRLPDDAEDVTLLVNRTGTRGVVGDSIVADAEQEGAVWVVPQSRARMMSRSDFMRRLEAFAVRLVPVGKL